MSSSRRTRRIVFVSPQPIGESLRSARAVSELDGVCLLGVCEQFPEKDDAGAFVDLARVPDAHDTAQLIDAVRRLAKKHGFPDRIVTVHETLLRPVSQAAEALGLQGIGVATVERTLDKSRLKRVLNQAGVSTARDQLITSNDDARTFVDEVGFPIVLKPLNGSGGLATWCIRGDEQLQRALEVIQPSAASPTFAEDYLEGQELSFDTVTIADEPRMSSICCYRPSILEALENPSIQWTCVMPRDIAGDRHREFTDQGMKAVRALSVGDAVTHMEGFLPEGGVPSFIDATLRPAGARIGPMLGFAYDIDPYLMWARVAVDACFDGPWERKYAVGTVFLRGMGQGRVECVEGVESVRKQAGGLVVESRLPRVGTEKSSTYTGDGYVTVRHPETQVVRDTLDLIAQTVCINYSHSTSLPNGNVQERWSHQLRYFEKRLNKPSWDDDSLPGLTEA